MNVFQKMLELVCGVLGDGSCAWEDQESSAWMSAEGLEGGPVPPPVGMDPSLQSGARVF